MYLSRWTAKDSNRFWSKVDVKGPYECWLWTAYVKETGYASFYLRSVDTNRPAHRISYALANPEWDGVDTIDHLCKNKKCQNPAHLEAVTLTENIRRSRR